MRVTRSVIQHTTAQCVKMVQALHRDVARLHCRLLVTERLVKDRLGVTEEELNATIEGMLRKEDDAKAQGSEKPSPALSE